MKWILNGFFFLLVVVLLPIIALRISTNYFTPELTYVLVAALTLFLIGLWSKNRVRWARWLAFVIVVPWLLLVGFIYYELGDGKAVVLSQLTDSGEITNPSRDQALSGVTVFGYQLRMRSCFVPDSTFECSRHHPATLYRVFLNHFGYKLKTFPHSRLVFQSDCEGYYLVQGDYIFRHQQSSCQPVASEQLATTRIDQSAASLAEDDTDMLDSECGSPQFFDGYQLAFGEDQIEMPEDMHIVVEGRTIYADENPRPWDATRNTAKYAVVNDMLLILRERTDCIDYFDQHLFIIEPEKVIVKQELLASHWNNGFFLEDGRLTYWSSGFCTFGNEENPGKSYVYVFNEDRRSLERKNVALSRYCSQEDHLRFIQFKPLPRISEP